MQTSNSTSKGEREVIKKTLSFKTLQVKLNMLMFAYCKTKSQAKQMVYGNYKSIESEPL